MIPRDSMTSVMTWISSAQLRGSWKTKTADIGVVEKSIGYSLCWYKCDPIKAEEPWQTSSPQR
jgi:hypothetical protein